MRTTWKTYVPASVKRRTKLARARLFETVGRDQYSWPALGGLDRRVLPHLPASGTFLEIGANDGYTQSNTYQLSRRGWSGILVEPVPSLFRACVRARAESQCFPVACGAPGGPDSVTIVDLNLMSTVVGVHQSLDDRLARAGLLRGSRIEVRSTTLSEVIDEAGSPRIDFMSVDVEGFELDVLAGLDLSRHLPSVLLVETTAPDAITAAVTPWLHPVDQLGAHDYLYMARQA